MEITQSVIHWWQQQTWPEIIAVVTGLVCVYLAAKNNILNWPFAIISVTIYIFIYYKVNLFADMGLQGYFLATNIYGWYYWSKSSGDNKKPVTRITRKEVALSALAVALFTFILGTLLKYTTASLPYIDSFCAACSIVAQVFLARKVLENWLLWVFVDVVYVGVYIFKGLHLTAIMYAVYFIIALIGYVDWKKDWRKQLENI